METRTQGQLIMNVFVRSTYSHLFSKLMNLLVFNLRLLLEHYLCILGTACLIITKVGNSNVNGILSILTEISFVIKKNKCRENGENGTFNVLEKCLIHQGALC